MTVCTLIVAVALVAAPPLVRAHEMHCHTVGADGKLTDAPEAKTKKACAAVKGVWEHHHAHCHKNDASGKHADLKGVKTEKACLDKSGTWIDHGHDPAKKK